ncbi:MAG: nuclear transport factor 2 family protein [Phycisphaerales bacterium]
MSDVRSLDTQLNEMTRQGKILDALEKFYDENCTFQEGNQPVRKGRAAQHAHLSAFFKTLKAFNGATLHAQTVGENSSISEWTFDMTGPDGPILWNEILSRRWRNGKVVSERFYTAA